MSNQTLYSRSPQLVLGRSNDDVLAVEGDAALRLSAPGIQAFVMRLDELLADGGQYTAQELSTSFDGSEATLTPVLNFLVQQNILVAADRDVCGYAVLASQRSGRRVSATDVQHRLDQKSVCLVGRTDSPMAHWIAGCLEGNGIRIDERDVDLSLVLGESEYDPVFRDFNRDALDDESGNPWLVVIPFDGSAAWCGPFLVPHQSACYTCFRLRRSASFAAEVIHAELIDLYTSSGGPRQVEADSTSMVLAGLVADLASEWIALGEASPAAMPGGFATVSRTRTGLELGRARVLRVPRCPDCSPARNSGLPQVWFHTESHSDAGDAHHHG